MNFSDEHFNLIEFLESILFEAVGDEIQVESYHFLAGGNINNAVKANTNQGCFFVKWNENEHADMFSCEAKGLKLLQSANEIHIPEIINFGYKLGKAYLILEYINTLHPNAQYWEDFGASLAKLHTHTQDKFGLAYNNYIGSLRQTNDLSENWVDFFIEKRLKVQAGLAFYNGELPKDLFEKFDTLYEKLPEILPVEKPSLLHGDLWSGNVMVGNNGFVTLIDPAVYYGSREAEIAFTKLFGGFTQRFYEAYDETNPLIAGFEKRIEIYNLYPLLVHVNLFGSGYLSGIERVLKKFQYH